MSAHQEGVHRSTIDRSKIKVISFLYFDFLLFLITDEWNKSFRFSHEFLLFFRGVVYYQRAEKHSVWDQDRSIRWLLAANTDPSDYDDI